MIIVQISPKRMGSTWQFNIIRDLLLKADIDFASIYWDGALNYRNGASDLVNLFKKNTDVVLIKSHFFDPELLTSLSLASEI